MSSNMLIMIIVYCFVLQDNPLIFSKRKHSCSDTPMGTHFCQFLFLIDHHNQSNLGFYPLHALLYQERFVFTLFIIKFEQIVMASE